MAGDDSPKSKCNLYPVYIVVYIKHKIRVLDGTKVTYNQWVKLFILHARGYEVLKHIDGTPAPAKNDATYEYWIKIDAHVIQWIYGSISDDLLKRILEDPSTAYEASTRLKDHFLNNKGSPTAALEHEFVNLTLESMSSLEVYCQKLKHISAQLTDVGGKVDDQRLVLQLVWGLPWSYDTVGAYINQTLTDFETARSMLQLEAQRQTSWSDSSPATVLGAPAIEGDSDDLPPVHATRQGTRSGNRGSRNNDRRGGRVENQRQNHHQQRRAYGGPLATAGSHLASPYWAPSPPYYWTTPSCPYPTQSGWANSPWAGQQQQQQQQRVSRQGQQQEPSRYSGRANLVENSDLKFSQYGSAFQALSLQNPDNTQWYMDTRATSHLTSDPGPQDWTYDYEEQ